MKQRIRYYTLVFFLLWICESQCQDADVIIKINRDTIHCDIKKLKKDFIEYSVQEVVNTISIDSVHFVNKQYWNDPKYFNDLIHVSYTPVQYSVVIYTDSVGANELYSEVYNWFSRVFNSPYDVIKKANIETGIVIAEGTRHYSHSSRDVAINGGQSFESEVKFTMKVECRENRYKVEMFNFIDSDLGLLTAQSKKITDIRPHVYYAVFPLDIQNEYDKFFEKQWSYCKADIRMFATSMIQSLEYATRDLKTLDERDDW